MGSDPIISLATGSAGVPVATPDGRVLAAIQGYTAEDASLLVLALEPSETPAEESPDVLYNEPASPGSAPTP